jgi:hypothetical protein
MADTGDIPGKTENFRVVDVVYHDFPVHGRAANKTSLSFARHHHI